MKLLHIYASEYPHGEVFIAGTKESLLQLQQAIADALENGKCMSDTFFTNDGEGYNVLVNTAEQQEIMSYTEPYAELHHNGPGPWLRWR